MGKGGGCIIREGVMKVTGICKYCRRLFDAGSDDIPGYCSSACEDAFRQAQVTDTTAFVKCEICKEVFYAGTVSRRHPRQIVWSAFEALEDLAAPIYVTVWYSGAFSDVEECLYAVGDDCYEGLKEAYELVECEDCGRSLEISYGFYHWADADAMWEMMLQSSGELKAMVGMWCDRCVEERILECGMDVEALIASGKVSWLWGKEGSPQVRNGYYQVLVDSTLFQAALRVGWERLGVDVVVTNLADTVTVVWLRPKTAGVKEILQRMQQLPQERVIEVMDRVCEVLVTQPEADPEIVWEQWWQSVGVALLA